jgi:hypothetical protein
LVGSRYLSGLRRDLYLWFYLGFFQRPCSSCKATQNQVTYYFFRIIYNSMGFLCNATDRVLK